MKEKRRLFLKQQLIRQRHYSFPIDCSCSSQAAMRVMDVSCMYVFPTRLTVREVSLSFEQRYKQLKYGGLSFYYKMTTYVIAGSSVLHLS